MNKLSRPMSIRLDEDVRDAIERLATADERSVSSFINRALRRYIDAVRGKRPDAAPEPALPELIELAPVKKKPAKKRA
jgi:Arc/MetJ-type ribon-helix-helix transcriptional regulator